MEYNCSQPHELMPKLMEVNNALSFLKENFEEFTFEFGEKKNGN